MKDVMDRLRNKRIAAVWRSAISSSLSSSSFSILSRNNFIIEEKRREVRDEDRTIIL